MKRLNRRDGKRSKRPKRGGDRLKRQVVGSKRRPSENELNRKIRKDNLKRKSAKRCLKSAKSGSKISSHREKSSVNDEKSANYRTKESLNVSVLNARSVSRSRKSSRSFRCKLHL